MELLVRKTDRVADPEGFGGFATLYPPFLNIL